MYYWLSLLWMLGTCTIIMISSVIWMISCWEGIQVNAPSGAALMFPVSQNSAVWTDHMLGIYPNVRSLDCFWFGAIMNNSAYFCTNLQGTDLGVEFLCSRVCVCLALLGNAKPFSKLILSLYPLTTTAAAARWMVIILQDDHQIMLLNLQTFPNKVGMTWSFFLLLTCISLIIDKGITFLCVCGPFMLLLFFFFFFLSLLHQGWQSFSIPGHIVFLALWARQSLL